jgi:hypothetical protein
VLTGFRFRAPEIPKNWNSEIPPRDDVLEIGPEWPRLRRHGGRDAGRETTRESANLAAWGGDSGRGPARGEGDRGRRGGGAAGFQVFRFSESGRSDFQARGLLTTQAVLKLGKGDLPDHYGSCASRSWTIRDVVWNTFLLDDYFLFAIGTRERLFWRFCRPVFDG